MKMLRTVLAAILVTSMLYTLAACGGESQTQVDKTANQTTAEASDTKDTPVDKGPEKDTQTGLTTMESTEPATFSVFIRDPSTSPSKDNPVLKKLLN